MHRRKHNNDYGETWTIAVILLDGPSKKEEIQKKLVNSLRKFGLMIHGVSRKHYKDNLNDWLLEILDQMIHMEWITEKDDYYKLTEKGHKEAEKCKSEINKSKEMLNDLLSAKKASIITMIVHFVLALIKLPAAILSGSVGLLNDAIDTTVDAVSSLIVYLGIQYNKESTVNIVLVIFMMITGGFTMYQAVKKIFIPEELETDILAFIAVIISALVCLLLYFYQRYVGAKTNTPALITQSVDSRNHVIAALGVTGGLIASLFNIIWIDIIVGLIMAILICKSAIELLIDLIKSTDDEEIDLSKYRFGGYHRFIVNRYYNWMLLKIKNGEVDNRDNLMLKSKQLLAGEGISVLEAFTMDEQTNDDWLIKKAADELFDKGMVNEDGTLTLTNKGVKYIEKLNTRWERMKKKNNSMMHNFVSTVYFIFGIIAFNFWFFVLKYIFSRFGFYPLWSNSVHSLINIRRFEVNTMLLIYYLLGFTTYIYGWVKLWQISHYNKKARDKVVRKPRRLITDRYYAKVRHPMYAKMICMQIGLFTALNIKVAYILCILLIAMHISNGLFEDISQLPRYFPKEFDEYKIRVKRVFFSKIEIIFITIIIILNVIALEL